MTRQENFNRIWENANECVADEYRENYLNSCLNHGGQETIEIVAEIRQIFSDRFNYNI